MSTPIPHSDLKKENSFNLNEFENKLNDDEKKIILSFLDISSLCNVNCVSKSFSLSQLSNDDLFWKDHYKNIITEYLTVYSINDLQNYHNWLYKNITEFYQKETEENINKTLQSTTQNYKNEIIKFFNVFEKAKTIQKERLSKMEYNKEITLQNKENLLQKKFEIMKGYKTNAYSDCKLVVVGDGAVGKTCMFMVLGGHCKSIKGLEYIPTVFDIFQIFVPLFLEPFVINLWDTAAAEVSLNQLYYKTLQLL
ncbi:hypothetical protein ABK040_007636 [Willaertia magna]